jgi:hypothetical protein
MNGRLPQSLCWGILLVVTAGCGGKGYDRYIPADDVARKALEAALTAWQNGRPPGQLDGASPTVTAVDSKWKSGKKLKTFEILKEETTDGPKCFSVRLTLKDSSTEQVVRYYVVGREPVWVYREDDFKGASGM